MPEKKEKPVKETKEEKQERKAEEKAQKAEQKAGDKEKKAEQKAERKARKQGGVWGYFLTPVLLASLCAGAVVLGYSLMPSHSIEKYLNLIFVDKLKTSSSIAGLNIVEKEIDSGEESTTYSDGEITYPKFGEQYAVLEAKDIGLSVGVYYGSNEELLKRGACQSSQTAVLGTVGNVVIDAHVNTFFADLEKLKPENIITLYTDYGRFTYKVKRAISFDKTDKTYVGVTQTDCLTLYTCRPEVLGDSDLRVGVRCDLVSKEFYTPKTES